MDERRKKVETLRAEGTNPYPAGYDRNISASEAIKRFGQMENDDLEKQDGSLSMAGRIMSIRGFGKASFIHIKDGSGLIQAYIRKDNVGDEQYKFFKLMDIGDFIGIKGTFFRTRTAFNACRRG